MNMITRIINRASMQLRRDGRGMAVGFEEKDTLGSEQ